MSMRTLFLGASLAGLLLASCAQEKPAPLNLKGSKQGFAVALVDLDGDGFEDKLVGAPYAQLSSGKLGAVLIYHGTAEGFAAEPDAIVTGDDNFGASLLEVGDLDGDGRPDVAVGALAGGEAMAGSVTILGSASGGDTLLVLTAGMPMAKFGYAIAAGDLDGDGARDLVVGAPFHTEAPAAYQGGAVYVFFGPDFVRTTTLAALVPADAGLGWAVAAGDVSADGIDDLLVSSKGKVRAFFGGPGFTPDLASPSLLVTGAAPSFGRSLAILGDVDGDSIRDVAIGAAGATSAGRDTGSVYVVSGGPRTVSVDGALPVAGLIVRLDGLAWFTRFGASLSATADVDGDGRPELAVGAPLTDSPGVLLAGRVHLFKSTQLGPSTVTTDALSFGGSQWSQSFGASLARSASGRALIGGPRADADTGKVTMVDLATGTAVAGSSGGATGSATADCCL